MAAYRGVYDSRHLPVDCQVPGSSPETYARQSSMGYLFTSDGSFQGGVPEADVRAEEGKCAETFVVVVTAVRVVYYNAGVVCRQSGSARNFSASWPRSENTSTKPTRPHAHR